LTSRQLHLRIICTAAPPQTRAGRATEFGLQSGRSGLLPGLEQNDGSIRFDCDLELYRDPKGRARFRGDCAQGTAAEAFVYLSWRWADDEASGWIGRVKLMLGSIAGLFDPDSAGDAVTLETAASGPTCGPIRQGDWHILS
ncbi:MAG TPA: DUF5990 family protein, partial [Dehalococcoidia bacterium]|nr:DUF5990 family protein [Dehalococcoidia bacterium]